MKIGFISLGCSKNLVDSERVMGLLKESGHTIVNDPNMAEAIFVNTCGFINPAKEEAINTILEMAEYKNKNCKKLIVLGCLAQRYKDDLIKELPEVDRFITLSEYPQLGVILTEVLEEKVKNTYGKNKRLLTTKPWLGYLKIAEGCSNRCTYCAIPLIRGPYQSFELEDLVEEAKQLAVGGVKELVVIAQDTTRYGIDIYNKRSLLPLLVELNKLENIHWIRILYMYPDEIDESLIQGMAKLDKVIPYFDIPVQHGNDKMLTLMNRRGSVKEIMDIVSLIRKTFKNPILRTTMIVGFPQEGEKEFQDLMDFIEAIRWDRLGAFTYSLEEDTPAYSMKPEVSQEVKENRLGRLMQRQEVIAQELSNQLIGETLEVLVESQDNLTKQYRGRSIYSAPDGIDGEVMFHCKEVLVLGSFVKVKITRALKHDLFGEYVL